MGTENGGQLVRLSSSFRGKWNGELAPLALGLEYFDNPELLACRILLESGVRIGLVAGSIVDLVDFGVGVSILSKVN